MADKPRFSLAAALEAVSKLDTGTNEGREQIEYIDIDRIKPDERNFYELSCIEELAASIEFAGLQQPIRVRKDPDADGDYIIVSGHRRHSALTLLVGDGNERFHQVPCIVDRSAGQPTEVENHLQELRLIYGNSDTRKLSSADLAKQAERVETLLYQLKEEGYEFPGRMRDHVAEVCKINKTKLANLKIIRENLEPQKWKPAWERGKVADSVALVIARLSPNDQLLCWTRGNGEEEPSWYSASNAERDANALKAIHELNCPEGGTCQHLDRKFQAYSKHPYRGCPARCCGQCPELGTCEFSCPHFAERVKQIKPDKREQRKQEKLAQEERDRPDVEQVTALWARFAEAREEAGLTIEQYVKAAGIYVDERTKANWPKRERGEKITRDTGLPYCGGNGVSLWEIRRLLKMADVLGVSLDYLLCRTDNPKGVETGLSAAPAEGWVPLEFVNGMETPPREGAYYCEFCCDGASLRQVAWWDSVLGVWRFRKGGAKIDAECVQWFPLPEGDV